MDHSWGYATDPRLRDENQDCHGVFEFPDFTLAVVCDGMGGHVGGAHASAIAVRTIHDVLQGMDVSDIQTALETALTRANQAIYEAARKNHRLMGMGTTVVAAAVTDDRAYLAHVGDSRGYLLRGGQVKQITRDHTMVNLFVDAELLTPEDAATHPEAHVLSRSLGVERTVDVELTDPVALEPDDVIFLCSDGVHGVITDWELGNVDWGAPHEGVQHVMDIVAAREGDDNATGVAVLLATSFEDVPPTAVPDPDALVDLNDGGYGGKGVQNVPLDEVEAGRTIIPEGFGDGDDTGVGPVPGHHGGSSSDAPAPIDVRPPTPRPQARNQQPSYLVYDEPEPEPESPPPSQVPDLRKRQKAAPGPQGKQQAEASRRRNLLLAALGVFMLGGVGLVGLLVVGLSAGGGTEVRPLEVDPEEGPTVHIEDGGDVVVAEAQPTDPDVEYLYKPEIPDPPRRLPHRPLEYTQPPPGGPDQWTAVQSARTRKCAESLEAVARGMKASIDHASLYSQSWFCYNEVHQRPLMDARVVEIKEFKPLIDSFRGPEELREELPDEVKKLPEWFQPPVDGIEHRLLAFDQSDNKDKFRVVMADLLGEPTLADQLTRDVLLEAQAAVALSKIDDPSDDVKQWWARRVYITAKVMDGPIGRLIERHRPELVEEIQGLLDASTAPRPVDPDDPDSKMIDPPDMVIEAYEVGIGERDAPNPNRVKRTSAPTIKEPEFDDQGEAIIRRGNDDFQIKSPD